MKPREFALPGKNPLRLVSYLMKYKRFFWIQAVSGILYNTVIVAGPILLGKTLDAASALEKEGVAPERVKILALFALLFVLVTIFFQYMRYVKRFYLRNLTNRIACDMRAGLLSKVLRYPMAKIEKESVGDLMSRTVGDVEEITSTMQTTINETWDTWLLMISYFVALLYYDYRITLICSIPIPLAILVAESVRHPLFRYSTNARSAASVVSSHLQKTLTGLTILRLFGREEKETERLKDYSRNQMRWNVRTSLFQTGMMPVYATLASLGVIGVIGLGGAKVVSGTWTIGTFTAFLTMFTLMSGRTWVAARTFNRWHAASASWKRIKDKLGEEMGESASSRANESRAEISTEPPYLRVEKLSFSYPGAKLAVLNDISFSVNEGDFVGVTGPVGSGKSTLAVLLTGLYPYSGMIAIEGKDLTEYSSVEKAKTIAYSGQDAFLFSASIARNITFQELSELLPEERSRLDEAVKTAALSEDMGLFPQGLNTLVGERGVRVSGGQRQRIALARAIFTHNPILILDDPFSAVDIGTEKRIIERMRENLKGKTVIIFSHRLAAFTGADKVIVLEKGRLAEEGSHAVLMAKGGIYQKIYSAQSFMESGALA